MYIRLSLNTVAFSAWILFPIVPESSLSRRTLLPRLPDAPNKRKREFHIWVCLPLGNTVYGGNRNILLRPFVGYLRRKERENERGISLKDGHKFKVFQKNPVKFGFS